MEFFIKNLETIMTFTCLFGSLAFIHAEFNDLNRDMNARFSAVEKDIAVMKTCLLLRNIIPPDMAHCKTEDKK